MPHILLKTEFCYLGDGAYLRASRPLMQAVLTCEPVKHRLKQTFYRL